MLSIDGTWNVIIDSPMGTQHGVLELSTEDDRVTGTGQALGTTMEVADGTANGDEVTFALDFTRPVPMRLDFHLSVSGDSIAGEAKAGPVGRWKVAGQRA
ncbi:hypothetical protein OG836_04140 [Micromonospora zamorensis]|uniref:hypothetical protein n=1 Tax=Micromonospora zamorensis TaxID=709883 RepID=UPI00117FCDDC|nr:hypothetical protein [Micromonospora zamorensis]WSK49757.1 hypothetical protein OG423_04965 [Micromonospora zamorensis]